MAIIEYRTQHKYKLLCIRPFRKRVDALDFLCNSPVALLMFMENDGVITKSHIRNKIKRDEYCDYIDRRRNIVNFRIVKMLKNFNNNYFHSDYPIQLLTLYNLIFNSPHGISE